MNPTEYIEGVKRSESHEYKEPNSRFLHATLGCVTEAGELADIMKKSIFYGKSASIMEIKEELGDQLWYIGVMIDELGSSFEEIMEMNIAKLKIRYPEKFTSAAALNRNLEAEEIALEGNEE